MVLNPWTSDHALMELPCIILCSTGFPYLVLMANIRGLCFQTSFQPLRPLAVFLMGRHPRMLLRSTGGERLKDVVSFNGLPLFL
jgi:hypothetical protein